ncbi:MAG TPA: PAS domain S-box protein, partial [Anaerolineaceae bacterium]|nr:PAS domain S-box protein [Anaerolineaceae bacterium]
MEHKNWRVLMVDDDEEDYLLTRLLLRESKGRTIELKWVSTYEAAQQHLQQDGFDAVLVDYDLGARTGVELIREMASSGYHAPAILYTGRGSYEVDLEAMQAGATLYLSKGEANPLLLERAIRYAIELKNKENELREARESAERELVERNRAEEKFSKAFRASPDALILSRRADGYIQEVNPAFEKIYGYRREEVIGKTSVELNLFADVAHRDRAVRELQAQGTLRDYNLQIRTKSGQIRDVSLSIEMIKIQNEPFMLTIARDVTEQKQAEEALRQSEEKFRFVATNLHDILFFQDPDLRYTWIFNPANPLEESEVIGKTDDELLPPEEAERLKAIKRKVLETGTGAKEALQLSPGGITRWYEAVYEPARDTEGAIVGIVSYSRDITDRKQAEEELRENEARFRALTAASAQVLYRMNPDWTEMRQLQGGLFLADTETADRDWLHKYIHPEDQGWVLSVIHDAVRTGTVFDLEHRVLRADGTLGWTASRAVPVRKANGEIVEWFGAASDITDRKRAEEALRQSEERYRQLADAMPQLVWTAQPDGTVDYYNQRYQRYGGIAPVGDSRWEWGPVLHPDDQQPTVAAWNEAVTTGTVYQIEHRVRMTDGSYRWHLSRGVPAHDPEGRLVKWFGTATDIHDFKQTQLALHQREQRLRTLFESSLIGIVIREPSGRILEANQAFLEITGYTSGEVEDGQASTTAITPPEYRAADQQCNEQVFAQGYCKPYEKEYIRKDGTRAPVLAGYSLFEGEQPEFIGYILDLSELKQAQSELASYAEQLRRSNKDLENFAFIASHDLQEPLRKIQRFGEQLASQTETSLDETS